MKKLLHASRIADNTISRMKLNNKSLYAFLFAIVMSFTSFSAKAAFSTSLTGPSTSVSGTIENYTFVFALYPPETYPVPVSAKLDIVGGVFVAENGSTTSVLYPTVNGTTNFKVRWSTTGKINVSFVISVPRAGNVSQAYSRDVIVTPANVVFDQLINSIDGPETTSVGSIENYSYNFSLIPPATYPTLVSARLTISGGVFISANGVASTSLIPTVGGTTYFRVRWQTSGKISATGIVATSSGNVSRTVSKDVLIPGSTVSGGFVNSITGPANSIEGQIENYTYTFLLNPPALYPIPVSATLNIVGGVFLAPDGTPSTTIYPVIGITNFRVKWQTAGRITATSIMGGIPQAPGNVTGFVTKHVSVIATVPDVSLTFGGNANALNRNTTYTVTASNAVNYEWAVSGDLTIVSNSGGVLTIRTGAGFATGSVQVRGQNITEWSAWKTLSLSYDCSIPTNLSIKGDGTRLSANRSYKFTANATNATEYQWTVEGNATINSITGNVIDIRLNTGYTTVRIGVRARKYCGWTGTVYYTTTNPDDGCRAPASTEFTLKQNFAVQQGVLCYNSNYPMIITGPTAEYYEWRITGSGKNCIFVNGKVACIAYGEIHRTTNNYINLTTEPASFNGPYVNVEVRAFFCNGTRSVTLYKYYNLNTFQCGIGSRLETSEASTTESIVYPNPVKSGEAVNVSLLADEEVSSISIGDYLGNRVKTIHRISESTLKVSTDGLIPGVYTLSINGKNGVRVKKIQVQ